MRLSLLMVTLCLSALCASFMATEYRNAIFYRSSSEAQIRALAQAGVDLGTVSSWRAKKEVLSACAMTGVSFGFGLLPEASKRPVREACAGLAQDVLRRSPTTGLAHLVLAQGADTDERRSETLVLAQATSPLEAFQVKLRTVVGLKNFDGLNERALAAVQKDVAVLLSADWGRRWLASAYLADESNREFLTAAIEKAPASDQSAFLAALKRAADRSVANRAGERAP